MNGRGDKIRTCDPLLPKQVLYQAELRPDFKSFQWVKKYSRSQTQLKFPLG
jgi:hypothetical protein